MKKTKSLILSLFLLVLAFSFGITFTNTNSVFAEDFSNPSEYYKVERAVWNSTLGKYMETDETIQYQEGDAFLIDDDGGVIATLGENTDFVNYTTNIQRLTHKITINDNITFDNQSSTALEGFGIKVLENENNKRLEIAIGPKIIPDDIANENDGAQAFVYGKYTIELSFYYLDENFESIHTTFKSSIYVLNTADYVGSNAIAYSNLATSGEMYYANYTTKDYAFLAYNHKNYNLSIVYLNKGLSKTTNIVYSNDNLTITNFDEVGNLSEENNVKILTENDKTYIIFTQNCIKMNIYSHQSHYIINKFTK